MMLTLLQSERDRILVHAETCYPGECCGFLLGRRRGDTLRVIEARPAANAARGLDRYCIAPETVLEAEIHSRLRHLEVLAIYHSHPESDAFPSQVDQGEAIPGTVHLIVGRGPGPELRAWALQDVGRYDPVPIRSANGESV